MCATWAAICLETFTPLFLPHTCTFRRGTKTHLEWFCFLFPRCLQVWRVQLTCSPSQIPPVNSGHSTTAHSGSLFLLHVPPPSPAELMGGMVIRISARGQRCVVLRLFWKDGWRRSGLPLCINRAAVAAGFVIAVAGNVKKKQSNFLKSAIFSSPRRCDLAAVAWVRPRQQLLIQNVLCESKPGSQTPNLASWRCGSQNLNLQLGGTGYLWTQVGSGGSDRKKCQNGRMKWIEIPPPRLVAPVLTLPAGNIPKRKPTNTSSCQKATWKHPLVMRRLKINSPVSPNPLFFCTCWRIKRVF